MTSLKDIADQANQEFGEGSARATWDITEYGNGGVEVGVSGRNLQAWHGLMTVRPGLLTMEQAFEAEPTLALRSKKVKLYDPDMNEVEGKFLIQRADGRHLGVVGRKYVDVDNVDLTQFGNDILDESGGHIETMVSLDGGKSFFVVFFIPKTIKIAGLEEETTVLYLMLSNSHDGSSKLRADVTPVRGVCRNSQVFAIKHAPRSYMLTHTTSITGRLQEAKNVLGITHTYTAALEELGNQLVGQKMRGSDFTAFLNKLVPLPQDTESRAFTMRSNAQQAIRGLYQSAENLEYIRGTKYAALQSVVEYWDHVMPTRETTSTSDENRFKRITTGAPSSLPNRALALLS